MTTLVPKYDQGATGAVNRPFTEKLAESISVLDFGADPTGVADSTTAIQAALTAGSGKGVYVPAGTYNITATLKITGSTHLFGDGEVSIITTALDIISLTSDDAAIYGTFIENIRFNNSFPVSQVAGPSLAATLTSGSPVVPVASIAGLTNGMAITGTGIPASTFIEVSNYSTAVFLRNFGGIPVNATASGAQTLSTFFAQGQTQFHMYFNNSQLLRIFNVTFTTSFTDVHYSPNNHAGLWLDRDNTGGGYAANVNNCFFHHAQLLVAISDSNIKNTIIWPNPFDFGLKLCAPGNTVEGCNLSAGTVNGALWTTATAKDASGSSNHTIVGNNIDGGGVWYTAYGVQFIKPLSTTFVGNRVNLCQKGGMYITDAVFTVITGNTFLNNNINNSLFSDIELVNIDLQSFNNTITGNSFAQTSVKSLAGFAVKDVNGGSAYSTNGTYTANAISSNYATPAISLIQPILNEQVGNIGSTANGLSLGGVIFDSVTLGNGTSSIYYQRTSSKITIYFSLTFGSTTSVSGAIGVFLQQPANALVGAQGSAIGFDSSTGNLVAGVVSVAPGGSYAYIVPTTAGTTYWNATVPWTWATGDTINFTLTYFI